MMRRNAMLALVASLVAVAFALPAEQVQALTLTSASLTRRDSDQDTWACSLNVYTPVSVQCQFDLEFFANNPATSKMVATGTQGCIAIRTITVVVPNKTGVMGVYIELQSDDKQSVWVITASANLATGGWTAWLLAKGTHTGKISYDDTSLATLDFGQTRQLAPSQSYDVLVALALLSLCKIEAKMRSFAVFAIASAASVCAAVIGSIKVDTNAAAMRRFYQPGTFTVEFLTNDEKPFHCIFDVAMDFDAALGQRYQPTNFAPGCHLGKVSTNELLGNISIFIEVLSSDKSTTIDLSITADKQTSIWTAWLLSTASHVGATYLGDETMRLLALLAVASVTLVKAATSGGNNDDSHIVAKRVIPRTVFTVDLLIGGNTLFECIFDVETDFGAPLSQRYTPGNFHGDCQLGRISVNELLGDISVLIELVSTDKTTTIDISVAADMQTGTWRAWLLSTASHVGSTYLDDKTGADLLLNDDADSGAQLPRCFYDTKLNQPGVSC
ncbi:uncharacterized protein L969DRAFT_92402 [Mixia osmundae IAM 14324]|uniref:Uncharacterized protein n=1 Tax=Mixia osmundae (strain CBS 9802 / IAM 14324 / JCM 22182 / KY 12970) TaxID=764103 RepID=G7DXM7_MIXOS|nr:uncharacterized protein L969DRAFT_92402 [Mixia osmundae IAM 14324]KEI41169.1 hypothetical protein L969DRAFT_92402 [Mixia osmundae IAM 14324]GAA95337.1 hypothetical protein E5Q_01994 [Mixia osmundae IAM 14324]